MEQDIDVTRYVIKFSIAYTFLLILLSAIFHIFELDSNPGASIGILIGAAVYSVGKFIQENKRIPNKSEKSKMVWLSLIISWAVSIFQFIIIALILEGKQGVIELARFVGQENNAITVSIVVFISLFYFALLSYSYGNFAKRQYNSLRKKGKV